MTDETSSLDEHRGMAAQRATEVRRQKSGVIKDQLALKERRAELEKFLFAAPADNWAAAVAKARYLLGLFAETPAAEDPRYQTLIEELLADFDRLLTTTANDNISDPAE
jgi:hypothetical protein